MRRVLIVSHSYSPAITPRAFRWSAIAEHWAKQGHHIDMVSSWMPSLPRYEIVNGVHVYRPGGAITEILRNRFQKPTMTSNIENSTSNSLTTDIKTLLKSIHDKTWKKVYWPDCMCLWYLPAVQKAKQLLKSYHYESLISVSEPFTGHLVGLSIKQLIPKINWLIDIGDPFCFQDYRPTNNHKLYKKLNYATEKNIFNKANTISVTTQATLDKYAELFPDSAPKIQVIPPLLSLDTSQKSQGSFFPNTENKVKLLFVGTLHKKIRNPDFLLKLFNELLHTYLAEKLELHFIGNINNCQDYFQSYKTLLNNKIFCHGKLSRTQAFQAMKEADILVNIGNDALYQLPSKVVEYISIGKPILNVAKIEEDSSMEFFKAYPASLCLLDNAATPNSSEFDKLIQFIEYAPSVEASKLKDLIAPYEIQAITEAYEALVFK
jgi:glycosyltransferase involved in cell wall biosynthesis